MSVIVGLNCHCPIRLLPEAGRPAVAGAGKAAVRAIHHHEVLVDVSHMSEPMVTDTLDLIESLDQASGAGRLDCPVIAARVRQWNSDPETKTSNRRTDRAPGIRERGGLMG
jgi:hypothetical protein